jgi:DNA methylase
VDSVSKISAQSLDVFTPKLESPRMSIPVTMDSGNLQPINAVQQLLFPAAGQRVLGSEMADSHSLEKQLLEFNGFGKETVKQALLVEGFGSVPVFINEFWTAKQRAASSLHEVSYRACFKPQLPRFFIERLTSPNEVVYDPFMGRGTTLVEAALLGRTPLGCDVNPLSRILIQARLSPPRISDINERLSQIDFKTSGKTPKELLTFYHPSTLREICALREYFIRKNSRFQLDTIDYWIWMVATNRLTGHSPGFFSVYTLPPNQAVSLESQTKINAKREQTPLQRNVLELILKKSRQLLADIDELKRQQLSVSSKDSQLLTRSSDETPEIISNSVALVVTSPPFLDVVDYEQDNWLRAWFCDVDISKVAIWQIKNLNDWEKKMTGVLSEVRRVLRPMGWVAFEVGEVRNGSIKLENSVAKVGLQAGLRPVFVLINDQIFTKTSNCWGVDNTKKGTNTNRVVLFQKEN